MDITVSETVVWPISLISGSAIIYITSQIVKNDSIINLMLNLRNPETQELMYSSKVYQTICPRCRVHGIKDCPHDVFMPRYFDKERALMVKLLNRNQSVYQREIRNEFVDNSVRDAFDIESINLLNDKRHQYSQDGKEIKETFVVIDPAAGGKSSCYAIMSFILVTIVEPTDPYKKTHLVVCTFTLFYLGIFIIVFYGS